VSRVNMYRRRNHTDAPHGVISEREANEHNEPTNTNSFYNPIRSRHLKLCQTPTGETEHSLRLLLVSPHHMPICRIKRGPRASPLRLHDPLGRMLCKELSELDIYV
jgi:hypothetical protein